MRAFVVGFPKSGTTTIHESLKESGLRSAHWKCDGGYVGEILYRNYYSGVDIFEGLSGYDAITQADVCLPDKDINYWPNLDFNILGSIREQYPDCLFILNWRDPAAIARSLSNWRSEFSAGSFQDRIVASDIPGLPRGYGATSDQLVRWIESHYREVRRFCRDANFVEFDIASEEAPRKLGEALGIRLAWWGQANIWWGHASAGTEAPVPETA